MDITQVTTGHLATLVGQHGRAQWLLVAGWPCQDLSTAGKSQGCKAAGLGSCLSLCRCWVQYSRFSPVQSPAYLLENVAFQNHHKSNIACSNIGQPVVIDSAQFGSLAHRVGKYWTNLCQPCLLAPTLQFVQRPPNTTVQSVLPQHRVPQPVLKSDTAPQYPCNVPGQLGPH